MELEAQIVLNQIRQQILLIAKMEKQLQRLSEDNRYIKNAPSTITTFTKSIETYKKKLEKMKQEYFTLSQVM